MSLCGGILILSGFRVEGFRVYGLGLGVSGLGLRVELRVYGLWFRDTTGPTADSIRSLETYFGRLLFCENSLNQT